VLLLFGVLTALAAVAMSAVAVERWLVPYEAGRAFDAEAGTVLHDEARLAYTVVALALWATAGMFLSAARRSAPRGPRLTVLAGGRREGRGGDGSAP
jgi:hypothetical protein